MVDLTVAAEGRTLLADWTDEAPTTRRAIEAALPLSGSASRWGDELYFPVPVDVGPEAPREVVPVGTIAYWPRGNALCLFWGPTPASNDQEPRAASPVNPVAELRDVDPLDGIDHGVEVRIDLADP